MEPELDAADAGEEAGGLEVSPTVGTVHRREINRICCFHRSVLRGRRYALRSSNLPQAYRSEAGGLRRKTSRLEFTEELRLDLLHTLLERDVDESGDVAGLLHRLLVDDGYPTASESAKDHP